MILNLKKSICNWLMALPTQRITILRVIENLNGVGLMNLNNLEMKGMSVNPPANLR